MLKRLGKRIVSVGHQHKGENHYNAKLNLKKVDEIIFLYQSGKTYKVIAKLAKVSIPTIAAVISGRRWKPSSITKRVFKARKSYKKLTPDDVSFIRNNYESGKYSQHELARKFSIAQCTVSEIVNSKIRRI